MKPLQDLLPLVEISSHYTLYLKCVNIIFAWYIQHIQFRSNVSSFPEEYFLNAGTNTWNLHSRIIIPMNLERRWYCLI